MSEDAPTLVEELRRSQDITNKALAAMTEQMAAIEQSLKTAHVNPTADGFGLTAMASAGISVPDFTGSVFDTKPDLGMAHLSIDSEGHEANDELRTTVKGEDRNPTYVTTAIMVVMILLVLAACDTCIISAALT